MCSEHLKHFSMATQFWPWSPHSTPFSFPCPPLLCCLIPLTTWENGFRLTSTWQGLTGSWGQVHPDLTGHVLPAWLRAQSMLPASACCAISLFSPDARSHGESPWQEMEVFCAVKNHRGPCFEFFTPTSVQKCWSHSHLPDSRAGQRMKVSFDLDLRELERASTVTNSLCQCLIKCLGKWEVAIISTGTEWRSVCSECEKSVYETNKKYKQVLEGNPTASNVLDMLITNYAYLLY